MIKRAVPALKWLPVQERKAGVGTSTAERPRPGVRCRQRLRCAGEGGGWSSPPADVRRASQRGYRASGDQGGVCQADVLVPAGENVMYKDVEAGKSVHTGPADTIALQRHEAQAWRTCAGSGCRSQQGGHHGPGALLKHPDLLAGTGLPLAGVRKASPPSVAVQHSKDKDESPGFSSRLCVVCFLSSLTPFHQPRLRPSHLP